MLSRFRTIKLKTLVILIFAFLNMLNESFGQSVVIKWESSSQTSILQIKNPNGEITELEVKDKSYDLPITITGDYYWRIKASDPDMLESDYSEWGLIKASDSVLEISDSLMFYPKDGSALPLPDEGLNVRLKFNRPKAYWDYFIEILKDGEKVIEQKVTEQTFKYRVLKDTRQVQWRVFAKSKFGNRSKESDYFKFNLEPVIVKVPEVKVVKPVRFKLAASIKGDKSLVSWEPQPDCSGYIVSIDKAKFAQTAAPEILIPLSSTKQIVKVVCETNQLNYGLIGIQVKHPVVKMPSHSRFYYALGVAQFNIAQDISNDAIDPNKFENNFSLQSHLLGFNFKWGENQKHSLDPYFRFSLPLDFSSNINVMNFGAVLKLALLKDHQKKFIAEVNQTRISYGFQTDATLSQTLNSFGVGYEMPVLSPKFHIAALVKKTFSTPYPSYELRSFYELGKKLSFHLSAQQNISTFEAETNGVSSDVETKILQYEAGLGYRF